MIQISGTNARVVGNTVQGVDREMGRGYMLVLKWSL